MVKFELIIINFIIINWVKFKKHIKYIQYNKVNRFFFKNFLIFIIKYYYIIKIFHVFNILEISLIYIKLIIIPVTYSKIRLILFIIIYE